MHEYNGLDRAIYLAMAAKNEGSFDALRQAELKSTILQHRIQCDRIGSQMPIPPENDGKFGRDAITQGPSAEINPRTRKTDTAANFKPSFGDSKPRDGAKVSCTWATRRTTNYGQPFDQEMQKCLDEALELVLISGDQV